MKVIDMHCDTMKAILDGREVDKNINLKHNNLSVDIEKMKQGDYMLQVFAAYTNMQEGDSLVNCLRTIDLFHNEIKANKEDIGIVLSYNDILKNIEQNKMSALLSIEEGACCKGDLGLLRNFYRLGVRMMTLTWNYENELGFPNEIIDEKLVLDRGLKNKGFEFIEEMENLGIIIDVSHLSDAGFYDILNNTKKPFVASHSNARNICGHRRNMTDDMIKKLSDRGGVMGLNFYSYFLNNNVASDDISKIEDMIKHVKHIKNIAGIEVIGLGSDFDGIDCKVEIENSSKMQILAEKMKKEGFTENEIEHIFYKNVLNLFKEIL
ncbi:MAG: dipeptidase [Intestinibacter bartlettii]|uniref:dipeptidase n=1 Tax=Intestinibacter bartlettii TaxID=261299 RepID=UPI0026F2D4F5|nr:dipeptidase [Intestinibacter bartlettii]MDO5010710.1 dipeptidase [Intestinibacter bartlettii]